MSLRIKNWKPKERDISWKKVSRCTERPTSAKTGNERKHSEATELNAPSIKVCFFCQVSLFLWLITLVFYFWYSQIQYNSIYSIAKEHTLWNTVMRLYLSYSYLHLMSAFVPQCSSLGIKLEHWADGEPCFHCEAERLDQQQPPVAHGGGHGRRHTAVQPAFCFCSWWWCLFRWPVQFTR